MQFFCENGEIWSHGLFFVNSKYRPSDPYSNLHEIFTPLGAMYSSAVVLLRFRSIKIDTLGVGFLYEERFGHKVYF